MSQALELWCEAQDLKIQGQTDIDRPIGSMVMSLREKEYTDWLMITGTGWRKQIDDTGSTS